MAIRENGVVMVHANKPWGGPVSNFRAIVVTVAIMLACAAIVILFFRA